MEVLHQPLTDDQQDRLTTSELRYYQSNYGNPTFERRMKRLIDSMGADTANKFGEELVKQIMRIYGRTDKLYQKMCARCGAAFLDIKWESTTQLSGILDCWECKARDTINN